MLQNLGLGSKPQMTIRLDNPGSTYSTLDHISGKVIVTAPHNTRFDKLEIQFLGSSKTFIEKLHTTPGMATSQSAFHNFLKLIQPIDESRYPQPRILEAGKTYEFPFLFAVPQQLLPRICRHVVEHESVRDLHLQVPPSLGGLGNSEGFEGRHDDFCPEMANIHYHVVARLQEDGKHTLSVKTRSVDILPSFDEQPPVNVDGPDSDYYLRKEKSIKKGLFKGRVGSLVVEADQPKSFRLSKEYPAASPSGSISTAAKIRIRFDPCEDNASPPRLDNLNSKLKISTWYSDAARPVIPNKKRIMYDLHQGLHSEIMTLSSRSLENVEWKFHKSTPPPSTLSRRDSAMSNYSSSDATIPSASERYQGKGFYTAEILMPVTLPANKHFVPTFHSCLVSRTYTLHFVLSTGGTMAAPKVEIKVPVQVSAEPKQDLESLHENIVSLPIRSSITAAEIVEEARLAEEFFVPRTISPLEETLVGNSSLPGMSSDLSSDLPPQYEAFSQGGRGVMIMG